MITQDTNEQLLQRLGGRVKTYRLQANLSQKALGLKAGVALNTVKVVEMGKGCSLLNFTRILRVFSRLDDLALLLPEPELRPTEKLKLHRESSDGKRQRASKQGSE